MTDLVILKLGQSHSDAVGWGAFASGMLTEAGRAASVSAASAVCVRFQGAARVIAVLPGEQVAIRDIPSPPKQASKLKAAAGYLLEDELAQSIDELHLVLLAGRDGARAFGISKQVIRSWIDAFAEADIAITEMTVDYAAIGGSLSRCVIASDGERIIASRGITGFAAEISLSDLVAPAFLEAAGDAVIVSYGVQEHVGRWATTPVERRPLAHEADLIALFASNLKLKSEWPDFLSGEFRPKRNHSVRLGAWRRSAALAAGLAASLVALGAASGLRDWRIAERYKTSAELLHKAAFPTYDGSDLRAHVRGLLASGAKTASFLEMTSRLTAGLESHPGVSIERIRFDASRAQYVFSIKSTSDSGIEAFRTGLASSGIEASDSGGYRRIGEQWVGEMTARSL
ncbi:MAG: type II secretion system protein GspL [Parvularculaceae bacterium]|nr:type II secretion system protein GspL [Parvularculaceae bacterium]